MFYATPLGPTYLASIYRLFSFSVPSTVAFIVRISFFPSHNRMYLITCDFIAYLKEILIFGLLSDLLKPFKVRLIVSK